MHRFITKYFDIHVLSRLQMDQQCDRQADRQTNGQMDGQRDDTNRQNYNSNSVRLTTTAKM